MLHGGLYQQPFGEGITEGAGSHSALDIGFVFDEIHVNEQHFCHAGGVYEINDVGFCHRAANSLEFPAHVQILIVETQSDGFQLVV